MPWGGLFLLTILGVAALGFPLWFEYDKTRRQRNAGAWWLPGDFWASRERQRQQRKGNQ